MYLCRVSASLVSSFSVIGDSLGLLLSRLGVLSPYHRSFFLLFLLLFLLLPLMFQLVGGTILPKETTRMHSLELQSNLGQQSSAAVLIFDRQIECTT
ncbi:hypothetical protein BDP27DRAFT_1326154 [Rhodocollybia butyracea]|uniref:Uncharacterized protein n=1 Tax=Rhodocollybia butyracea TaxID=206335 RepID=A0A9P5PTM0_9AGAR|nr:hypothetical protein BDP27DRAFT_1326154 [Rhodocollybia butyracea]